jgi:hypothetical protein
LKKSILGYPGPQRRVLKIQRLLRSEQKKNKRNDEYKRWYNQIPLHAKKKQSVVLVQEEGKGVCFAEWLTNVARLAGVHCEAREHEVLNPQC